MEVSLPSTSWRGKGSLGPVSHLLDWERGHFGGLAHRNSALTLVSTRSAQVWPSPAPPVSIGAGVLGWEGPATGASGMGDSSAGVSCGGAAVVPILGPLGPTTGPSAHLYDSSQDSLGFSCGHLGNGAPIKWEHSWTWPPFDEQPVEVAPSFDPEGELREVSQMEASSHMELLSDI